MRTVLLAYGTRGDVQPYVALGLGLQRAGDSVCLAAPAFFEGFVRDRGLEYYPLPGDPARLIGQLAGGRQNPARVGLALYRALRPLAGPLMKAARAAVAGADAIIHSFVLTGLGHTLARQSGAPDISALIFPVFSPTGAFPNPFFPSWPLGAAYNRQTHAQFENVFRWGSRRLVERVGRPAAWPFEPDHPRRPILYGISPVTLPRPVDWPAQSQLTGYWFLADETDWQPSVDLLRFLDHGEPPVLVGFGSMVNRDAERQTRLSIEALQRTGRRGLLLTGWGGLGAAPSSDQLFALPEAPLDWLLPRVAAAVHHGGAGTSAAVFRAGVPGVIVPHLADQYFWGRRAYELGVAPAPLPRARLTAASLAGALRAALEDGALRRRAVEIGERIRAEDGVAAAVAAIHSIVRQEG